MCILNLSKEPQGVNVRKAIIGAILIASVAATTSVQVAGKERSVEQIEAALQRVKNDPNASQELKQLISLPYVKGPTDAQITDNAHIVLSEKNEYLSGDAARQFIELNGNIPGADQYIVMPRDMSWFSVFAYNDSGHVNDNEPLDSEKILQSLRDGQALSNEQRRSKGLGTLTLEGWSVPPHYDSQTHHLEWGVLLHDDQTGDKIVNYTTRLLGREGVMAATLITNPKSFDGSLAEFRQTLAGFQYNPERTYQAWRQGDRVAEYGLAALITGGAAAAVVKSGAGKGLIAGALIAMKGFIKVIALAIIGVFAAAWNKIKSLFGRGES